MKAAALLVPFAMSCTNVATAPIEAERDARFVGTWAVEQPFHALYEVTYYDFASDGSLRVVGSNPSDCTGHLEEHCVTGSVANCVPSAGMDRCDASTSCVFGETWASRSASTLVVAGACSDGVDREIVLEMTGDPSSNTGLGGAGATLVSVGGSQAWSHNTWEWSFRKCASSDTDACSQSPF